jgi:hypothetical protein
MTAAAAACGALFQASVTAQARPAVEETYRRRVAGGSYGGDYQSIAIRRIAGTQGSFWMVEQRKRATVGVVRGPTIRIERRWADGRACPELAPRIEVLVQMLRRADPSLPRGSFPPGVTPPKMLNIPEIPSFHGNRTYVGVLKPGGAYAVSSDYEGQITKWWRTTEQALVNCWTYSREPIDGAELPLTLETDADEAPYIALELAH